MNDHLGSTTRPGVRPDDGGETYPMTPRNTAPLVYVSVRLDPATLARLQRDALDRHLYRVGGARRRPTKPKARAAHDKLIALLRQHRAGTPMRTLMEVAGASEAMVSRYFTKEWLPPYPTMVAFARHLNIARDVWWPLWQAAHPTELDPDLSAVLAYAITWSRRRMPPRWRPAVDVARQARAVTGTRLPQELADGLAKVLERAPDLLPATGALNRSELLRLYVAYYLHSPPPAGWTPEGDQDQ